MSRRKKKTTANDSTPDIKPLTSSISAVEKPSQMPPVTPEVEIPPEVRMEMAKIVGELLRHASDLAFIMVEIEDEKIRKSPLYRKAKEIVRAIRKLRDILPTAPS